MKLFDEKSLADIASDAETSGGLGKRGLGKEDHDFLKSLEKMAEEIEEEPNKPR